MTKIVEAVGRAGRGRKRIRALLAAIDGLTLDDCLEFFDQPQDERTRKIVEMAEDDDTFEAANYIMTDSELNGAYVLCWRWVDFEGTDLDETRRGERGTME